MSLKKNSSRLCSFLSLRERKRHFTTQGLLKEQQVTLHTMKTTQSAFSKVKSKRSQVYSLKKNMSK